MNGIEVKTISYSLSLLSNKCIPRSVTYFIAQENYVTPISSKVKFVRTLKCSNIYDQQYKIHFVQIRNQISVVPVYVITVKLQDYDDY